jgi:hypothetical protein
VQSRLSGEIEVGDTEEVLVATGDLPLATFTFKYRPYGELPQKYRKIASYSHCP